MWLIVVKIFTSSFFLNFKINSSQTNKKMTFFLTNL